MPEIAEKWRGVGELPEETAEEVRSKKSSDQALRDDPQWWSKVEACNLWTAAFFMPLTEAGLAVLPTSAALGRYVREQQTGSSAKNSMSEIVAAANLLAEEKHFFHWPLEFPEVTERGGFDCILGNPPWERMKLQKKEFFAGRNEDIANSSNTIDRNKMIECLPDQNLLREFAIGLRDIDAYSKFIRASKRYQLTAIKDFNLYAIFTENMWNLINSSGKIGCIVPPGIATDDPTKLLIQELVETNSLSCFYDFTNRGYIFTALESTHSFSLLTLSRTKVTQVCLAAQLWKVSDLSRKERVYTLIAEDIKKFNPNTLNLPILRTSKDIQLIGKIYNQVPILHKEGGDRENPWITKLTTMFHMSSNSEEFFKTTEQLILEGWEQQKHLLVKDGMSQMPLYESKLTDIFNHRESTFAGIPRREMFGTRPRTNKLTLEELSNPDYYSTPRYWVPQEAVKSRIPEFWKHHWLIGFRNAISAVADSRSARFVILPEVGVGHSMPLVFVQHNPKYISALVANFNSLVLDYIAKQKASGGNFSFYVVKQLPIIPPETYTKSDIDFISSRVLELVYTAWDMQPFAQDMGYTGAPFAWNPERRATLRAELDAYYAYLYGLTRDELRYILDPADIHGPDFPSETFRVLKNNEMKQFGEYRTQRLVLEAWDQMFERPARQSPAKMKAA